MKKQCLLMEDYVIQYANNTIEEDDKIKLVAHLKECPRCREELALTIKLQDLLHEEMVEVPQELLNNIFTEIQEPQLEGVGLKARIKSTLEPLKIVGEVLITVKKSVNLALKFI